MSVGIEQKLPGPKNLYRFITFVLAIVVLILLAKAMQKRFADSVHEGNLAPAKLRTDVGGYGAAAIFLPAGEEAES